MQSVNNDIFQEAINNEYYKKILYKVCNENLRDVCSKDEIQSIALTTLWNCLQKYKNNENAKFSSYLYRSIQNNSRRLYKKKIKTKKEKQLFINQPELTFDPKDKEEARDILMSVQEKNKELYNVLFQKFFCGMTNKEIGQANGYGKEAARKKLKKALELCREIVYM
jgi:RNA polymerase sigma factor (sigma-70 family)